jgi:hypothetical protein
MPAVFDLIEAKLLDDLPPRRLPAFFLPNLIGEYLIERPLRSYFDPLVLGGVVGAIVMLIIDAPEWLWVALISLMVIRIAGGAWWMFRDVYEDYLLLRYGVVMQAHIMGVRTSRNAQGGVTGAFVDCAIPITRRRTSVGSVWFPDANAAMNLSKQGRISVICLQKAPGAWRLREGDGPHLRYEPTRD